VADDNLAVDQDSRLGRDAPGARLPVR
jgi:hypothetical protein